MGDGLKLAKDKRHRSSSSLAGAGLEGTRSERKLDIRALIPEDDHFALAESRCDELQEKIDLVKVLKRKKKLNKRSVTRVNEPTVTENVPFITVRTQPKKKVSQQAARLRRCEVPPNPTRGYLDPATVEQHRMLNQVWGYGQNYNQNKEYQPEQKPYSRTRPRRNRADGDGMCGHGVQSIDAPTEVACGQDDDIHVGYSDTEIFDQGAENFVESPPKTLATRRRNYSRDNNLKEVPKWIDSNIETARTPRGKTSSVLHRDRRRHQQQQQRQNIAQPKTAGEERPVVELFNKSRSSNSPVRVPEPQRAIPKNDKRAKKPREIPIYDDQDAGQSADVMPTESKKVIPRSSPRRVRYRSRGYELPTVASQMKQVDIRYQCSVANRTNIPFVVSKSTAPSHNIGVNIQQVLNGLKNQQPLHGIPLTIAHHMGLGYVPTSGSKSATAQPSLENRDINAVKLGQRMLMLVSDKLSFSRMLTLYRENDGMVSRFLRAISRPNYFYTSMYNLATNREDMDGATSKGRRGSHDPKQKLEEYASLYREYEQVEQRLKENHSPELERRRDELFRELTAREELVQKLVQDSCLLPGEPNLDNLHASLSVMDDSYRHSTFKLNTNDQAQ